MGWNLDDRTVLDNHLKRYCIEFLIFFPKKSQFCRVLKNLEQSWKHSHVVGHHWNMVAPICTDWIHQLWSRQGGWLLTNQLSGNRFQDVKLKYQSSECKNKEISPRHFFSGIWCLSPPTCLKNKDPNQGPKASKIQRKVTSSGIWLLKFY